MDTRALAKPAEVAEFLGVPEPTLAQWRYAGSGPAWSKVGRHIRYRWENVEAWVDKRESARATPVSPA
jgi:excisionase family DNA binding protein